MLQVRGSSAWAYGVAVLATVVVLLLRLLLTPALGSDAPLLTFIIAVMVASWYGGLVPGLLATALSLLAGIYFFVPPTHSLYIARPQDGARVVLFALVGVVIAWLSESVRAARQRAEASALAERQSEERFRLMVEGVQDHALFLMEPDGRIVSWNPGVGRVLGYGEAEIVGRPVAAIFTPEDRERGVPERELRKAQTEGRAGDDRWHVRRDGTRFFATGTVHPLRDGAGNLRGFCKIMRDITERKRAEEALAAAYKRERRIAESLQRSLLLTPPEDLFPGLAVATSYEAAWDEASVGGDFFDAFALGGGKVALVVGDATGKGLAAAVRTAEVKFALRAFLREYPDPERGLARLNDFLCDAQRLDNQSGGGFIVLSLMVVDPATGDAVLTAAGAEPPLVVRAGGEAEVAEAGGVPLGILPQAEYTATALRLAPGDVVLMATDGITEARRGKNDFLGHDGMIRLAQQSLCSGSLRQTAQAVMDGARAFAGGTLQDDACLLLAKRL